MIAMLDRQPVIPVIRIGDAGAISKSPAFHTSAPVCWLKAATACPGPPTVTMIVPL